MPTRVGLVCRAGMAHIRMRVGLVCRAGRAYMQRELGLCRTGRAYMPTRVGLVGMCRAGQAYMPRRVGLVCRAGWDYMPTRVGLVCRAGRAYIPTRVGLGCVLEKDHYPRKSHFHPSSSYTQQIELNFRAGIEKTVLVTLNGSGIQLAVGSQHLRLRNHNFGLTHRIMVKRLETSPHDLLGITDSACKNQLVVVSVQYGPFNTNIPIRSTTIGKSRVARDPITMHTSWRSNSDIACVTRSGNHLESPNEDSSIDHQMLVSNSGGLILILTAQSTRNGFRINSDY
ncbi:hypothetical protein F511_35751 [Dorcoceras hygrometricum]|uniref:Uncharacterized protein n=1 Tax=Dorcoceras hygrometricum TaxID=472368 RepID=A0A2Z7AZK0_9LAMI|nr:hypothetical protein F511_35751 [Dorcoceras hygrometricum]